MRLLILLTACLTFYSCHTNENSEEANEVRSIERPELSEDSKIFLGNRLFSEKTCITCHAVDKKKIGPSVLKIVEIYTEKNGDMEAFLKGKSNPIVDTTSTQVAIMQANIDGFLKKVTDEELNAITTYMLHVSKLNKK